VLTVKAQKRRKMNLYILFGIFKKPCPPTPSPKGVRGHGTISVMALSDITMLFNPRKIIRTIQALPPNPLRRRGRRFIKEIF
jgi:hypothetical protein